MDLEVGMGGRVEVKRGRREREGREGGKEEREVRKRRRCGGEGG